MLLMAAGHVGPQVSFRIIMGVVMTIFIIINNLKGNVTSNELSSVKSKVCILVSYGHLFFWFLKHKVGKKFPSLICCTLPPAFFFLSKFTCSGVEEDSLYAFERLRFMDIPRCYKWLYSKTDRKFILNLFSPGVFHFHKWFLLEALLT